MKLKELFNLIVTLLPRGPAARLAPALFLLSIVRLCAQVNEAPVSVPENYVRPDRLVLDERQLNFLRLPGFFSEYVLGPGDLIDVQIVGMDYLNQSVRITNSGKISLAHLGVFDVANMTPSALEEKIAAMLVEKKLLREPQVLVFVSEYRSKPVYILGEVDRPGEYIMSQELYLMDAILLAGGLDITASDRAFLHRRPLEAPPLSIDDLTQDPSQSKGSDTEVVEIDLRALKEGGVLAPNPLLRAGDVLFIPERKVRFFFTIGDVNRAGFFQLPDKGDLLVSRAIALAGGPRTTAKMSEGVLVRYEEDGTRKEHKVDFAAILEGRQSDMAVRPNDVIFIPGSTAKTLGYGLLSIVPRFAHGLAMFLH